MKIFSFFARPTLVFFVLALVFFLPFRTKAAEDPLAKTLDYLASHQLDSGAIYEEGDPSARFDLSAWSAISFAAAGYDPMSVKKNTAASSLGDYLVSNACSQSDTLSVERSIIALKSFGFDLNLLPCDLFSRLEASKGIDGSIGGDIIGSVFGLLSYGANQRVAPAETVAYVLGKQNIDGGFEPYAPWGTESTFTAQTIQALTSANVSPTDDHIIKAKQFLKSLQTPSGGFKYQTYNTDSNSGSTAAVIMAIYSLGESPEDTYWLSGSLSALSNLADFIKKDGSFLYDFDPLWGDATPVFSSSYSLVVAALEQKFLPFRTSFLRPYNDKPQTNPTPLILPQIEATNVSTSPVTEEQDEDFPQSPTSLTLQGDNKTKPEIVDTQLGQVNQNVNGQVLGENSNGAIMPEKKFDRVKALYLALSFGGAFLLLYLIGKYKNA